MFSKMFKRVFCHTNTYAFEDVQTRLLLFKYVFQCISLSHSNVCLNPTFRVNAVVKLFHVKYHVYSR